MQAAERLFFLVTSPAHAVWVRRINPDAISLEDCYAEGKPRPESYREMADRILEAVRGGFRTCAAFYGHPGVFAQPSHAAIRARPSRRIQRTHAARRSRRGLPVCRSRREPRSTAAARASRRRDFLLSRRRFDPTSASDSVAGGAARRDRACDRRCRRARSGCGSSSIGCAATTRRATVSCSTRPPVPDLRAVISRCRSSLPAQTITPAMTLYVRRSPTPQDQRIARWFDDDPAAALRPRTRRGNVAPPGSTMQNRPARRSSDA